MSDKKKDLSKDKKAGSTAQECPLEDNVVEICDAGDLELKFIDGDGKTYSSITKDNRGNRSKQVVASDFPPYTEDEKYSQVSYFDTILEVTAPPLLPGTDDPKSAEFIIVAPTAIGVCPNSLHPKVSLRVSKADPHDEFQGSRSYVNQSLKPMKIYGKALSIDNNSKTFNLQKTLFFLERTSDPQHVKNVLVSVESCGVRDDGSKPNKELRGLIRVYRNDVYKLELTVPSLLNKESSFKKVTNIATGDVTKTEAVWAGGPTHSAVFGRDGDIKKYSMVDDRHFTKKSVSSDFSDPSGAVSEGTTAKNFLKFTRNDIELNGLDTINQILEIRKAIISGFNFVDELKSSVPQVGFSWKLSLDVVSGKLTGEWGIKPGTSHDTDAYKFVAPYGQINVDLSLLKFAFEASFGLECKSPSILNWFGNPAYEIVAKVAIAINLSCQLKRDFTLVGDSDVGKIPKIGKENSSNSADLETVLWANKYSADAKLYGKVKVNVVGYGIDAEAGIKGGIEATFTVVKPFRVRGTAKRGPGVLYAYFTSPGRKDSPPWTYNLYPEKSLMKEKYVF